MKVKIRNIKNKEAVKEIDSNLLGDYLTTKEWEKVEDKTEKKEEKTQESNKTSFGASTNSDR